MILVPITDIVLIALLVLTFTTTLHALDAYFYEKELRKLKKAIKELKKYGFTNIDTD